MFFYGDLGVKEGGSPQPKIIKFILIFYLIFTILSSFPPPLTYWIVFINGPLE